MQARFVRYIRILGTSCCVGLVLVGIFNWVIDPYDDLGKNWIGVYTDDNRETAKSILSFPHDAIILGSSRTMHINPDHLCKYKFYNASFPSALPEEIYYYLERFTTHEKLVAIGLDFYMFNERSVPLLNINKWPDRYWPTHEYLLGWNVFIDSIKAVYKRYYLHYEGLNNGYQSIADDEVPDMKSYQWYLQNFVDTYKDYHLSEVRLQYMQKIRELLDARHIPYIIFINPMQEDHWKALHLSGSDGIFVEWIKRLHDIFPDLKYFSEGQYSQKELYKNDDPSHYLPVLGDMFMSELLGCSEK